MQYARVDNYNKRVFSICLNLNFYVGVTDLGSDGIGRCCCRFGSQQGAGGTELTAPAAVVVKGANLGGGACGPLSHTREGPFAV